MTMDRRSFLKHSGCCAGALAAAGSFPSIAVAGGPNRKKLIVINMAGGGDALSMVPPVMDPLYPQVRPGNFTFLPPGTGHAQRSTLELDGFFGMHPGMSEMHAMYGAGELVAVHATSIQELSRNTFSHFEETRFLHTLDPNAGGSSTGWLNRLLTAMEGESRPGAMAVSGLPGIPQAIQGPEPTAMWTPPSQTPVSGEVISRMLQMYGIGNEISNAFIDGLANREAQRQAMQQHGQHINFNTVNNFWNFPQQAELLAIMMAANPATSPSIGYLEFAGNDIHIMERDGLGYPWARFRNLSQGVGALKQALINFGVWQDTVIVIMSEFGRSVVLNGQEGGPRGCDHGYGQVGFIISGNRGLHQQMGLSGVAVAGQWPGLADLVGNHSLRATSNFLDILRGYMQIHYDIDANLAGMVIPMRAQGA